MRYPKLLLIPLLLVGMRFRMEGAEEKLPVWLMGNDFHTSIVLRARDVPYRREIDGEGADELAIGFGARADYIGPSTLWTELQAIFPNRGALHVAPIRGSITRRYPNSDLVLLWLDRAQFATLLDEINRSFAFTRDHRRVDLGRGNFPDGRYYSSSERFYFPYVCNEWVAIKMSRAGVPFFLPRAILSNSLILQAAEKGRLLQRHNGRPDYY